MRIRSMTVVGCFVLALSLAILMPRQSFASEFEITPWQVPGDGKTPTAMQYLNAQEHTLKPHKDLVGVSSKGDAAYTYALNLPPAILQPSLSLSYSSDAGVSEEMAMGWSLQGITEIRLPLSPAFTTLDKSDWNHAEWLVSGPGFSGTLQPSGNNDSRFFLHTASPSYVVAEYDSETNTWQIFQGGITYELSQADVSDESNAYAKTAWWRVTKATDTSGNAIVYSYHENGLIDSISYGGNVGTATPIMNLNSSGHLVKITFSYESNEHARTSARAGFLTIYANHITKITVNTLSQSIITEPTVATKAYAFILSHVVKDEVDLLTTLKREDASGDVTETIAEFTYRDFSTSPDTSRTTDAPSSLGSGYSLSGSRTMTGVDFTSTEGDFSAYAATSETLTDINRDGLPDVLSSHTDSDFGADFDPTIPWIASHQSVNHTTRELSWADPATVSNSQNDLQVLLTETAASPDQTDVRLVTTRQVLDIDGDGYLDYLESSNATSWNVHYGNGDFFDAAVTEPAPSGWTYSQVSWSIRAVESITSDVTDIEKTVTMDLNGDGWLDAFDPDGGYVWYHTGNRGGGWGPRVTLNQEFDAIRSVQYTYGWHASALGALLETCNASCRQSTGEATGEEYEACFETCTTLGEIGALSIRQTDETQGFYDINGDGLPDHIDASDTPWVVTLGNGHGFEDAMAWSAPVAYIQREDEGYPHVIWDHYEVDVEGEDSTVYQKLIDVDGDGLLDLAIGKTPMAGSYLDYNKWFKNIGSGFDTEERSLPSWWPSSLTTSTSYSESIGTTTSSLTSNSHSVTSTLTDIDHDGMVDLVTSSSVTYGRYPKAYVLTKISNGQGGTTDITYRSLATVSPSGDSSEIQYTPNIKNLVDTLTTEDEYSGQTSGMSFTYADGYYEKGVFQGFDSHTAEQTLNDEWIGKSEFAYELDRDYAPLNKSKKIYVDANLSFGSSINRGTSVAKKLRYQIDTTYATNGSNATGKYVLPATRNVTEYGEVSGSETVTHSYDWDDYGNLKSYENDGGGNVGDDYLVTFTYVGDSADPTFFRISGYQRDGINPLTGDYGTVAAEGYFYDDHTSRQTYLDKGLLTRNEKSSGWIDGGESATGKNFTIDYTHGSRGEVTHVQDNDTGIAMDQEFGFGAAVLTTQTNALDQTLSFALDERGRVTSMSDPNDIVVTQTLDDFNRVTQTTVTEASGNTHTVSSAMYERTTAPYYTRTKIYDDSGAVDQTSYSVEDGFGNIMHKWHPADDGDYLVTAAQYDLRGLESYTLHPKTATTFSASTGIVSSFFTKTYYDALGEAREMVRDANKGTGALLVYHDSPWQEVRQDENGYQTRLTYDAHHRITKVEQGQDSSYTTTATYAYDAMNRLVRFRDGSKTGYAYSYDTAGRLREVKRNNYSVSSPYTPWYTFEYLGMLKTKMTDATGAYAAWEYDTLGRATKMTVSDSLPSAAGTLTYEWDYDDQWIGGLYKSIDPSGYTRFTRDLLGRESSAIRYYSNWASTPDGNPVIFTFDNDLQGHVTTANLPSGKKLNSTYAYGYLLAEQAYASSSATTPDFTLDYDYDKWGKLTDAVSSLGHTYSNIYTTPLWPDRFQLSYGTTTYIRDYMWQDNGLMSSHTDRTENSGTPLPGGATYSLGYDSLKQVTSLKTPTNTIETYAYDGAGNVTAMKDALGITWTNSIQDFNKIPTRTASNGGVQDFTHDAVGRIATWKKAGGKYKYYYDGLGRVRGVTLDGVWQMVLDYDADGNLLRKADNNPNTASPYYAYHFRDWRYDEKTGVTTENVSPLVADEGGTRKWFLTEYDGHVGTVLSDSGSLTSSRTLGVYGDVIASTGTAWDWNAFHGNEDQGDIFHIGQRHLIQKDGLWLQPEPLLYLGIPANSLADPLTLAAYRYGRNNPAAWQDPTGFASDNSDRPTVRYGEPGYEAYQAGLEYEKALVAEPLVGAISGELALSAAVKGSRAILMARDLAKARGINPTGSKINCQYCALALEKTLAGVKSIAASDLKPNVLSGKFFAKEIPWAKYGPAVTSLDEVVKAMQELGPNARGIVRAISDFTDIGVPNHIVNVVNRGGDVRFLDGQIGNYAKIAYDDGYGAYQLMVTYTGIRTGTGAAAGVIATQASGASE